MDERLLTIDELAEYLQVSAKTIYRMIHRKQIPCYKVANQWRFKWSVIQAWMENQNFRAPEESDKPGRSDT
ncbi:helix-turn-helix domain-containing protein [bacterium]|nr:helix-turn-helix domain-containing protein [bacterium]